MLLKSEWYIIIYYLMVKKAIWLDIALVLYFHLPTACENTAAHSCNIQPYCLLNHQTIYIHRPEEGLDLKSEYILVSAMVHLP